MTKVELLATGQKFLKHGLRGTEPAVEEIIRSATEEIHVLAYMITSHAWRMLRLLEESLDVGIAATIVINRLHSQRPAIVARLKRLETKYHHLRVVNFIPDGGDLHAKVIVADRRRAVIGSANLTFGGMARNYEVGVMIDGREAWKLSKIIDSLADG